MGMVRFDQIARECRETFKGSFEGKPIVGLEHIEPYDMLLKNYDVDVETTFTKSFKKGQILFGRRRAYQHKACVATCDGICSGDITVIEPIEDAVYPDLLPFIIQNDDFFEHAIKGSNGALSPRVKWEHMANFEVDLPSIYEQKVLADKLWAAYEVKQSYLKMIDATEEMVKSQFIEMFGTIDEPKVEVKKLIDVVLSSGQYGSNTSATDYQEGKPRYIRITDINDDGSLNDDIKTAEVIEDKYRLIPGDIVFARTGATVGKTYMHETGNAIYAGYLIKYQMNESKMKPAFMKAFTHSKTYYNWVANSQKVGAQPNISAAQYDNMPVLVPQIEKQEEFLAIYHQADKSEFELRKSIDAIDKVIKSLINENL
jgi:type I restriction enzyme S subunit